MSSVVDLGRRYLDIQQPERALDALGRADETELADPDYWSARATALLALERVDEAVDSIERGLGLDPEGVVLLSQLAEAEMSRGDLAAAERAVLGALKVDPDHPHLLVQYSVVVARAGQFDKAERLLARAAELEPESAEVARGRYFLAAVRGDSSRVRRHGGEILEHAPDDASAHVASGLGQLQSGDVGGAYTRLREAASLDPRVVNELRDTFEDARLAAHWAMWPLRPLQRFSPVLVTIVPIGILFALARLGFGKLAGLLGIAWIVYCVYSWVVPLALRRWLARGRS